MLKHEKTLIFCQRNCCALKLAMSGRALGGDAERLSQFRMQLDAITGERDRLIKHVSNEAARLNV